MRLGVIGIGQAGGRIADLLYYHSVYGVHGPVIPFCIAVNSARADLVGLKMIPKRDRILIGQTEVGGHGVGLIREMGKKVARDGLHTIMHTVMERQTEYIDAFLLIVGLGGGTGSGAAPVIAEELRDSYELPIFVLGVLPADEEGKLLAKNALECLDELLPIVNGVLLFDNNLWRREGLPLEKTYKLMNHWLVKPIPIMLGAGEAPSRSKVGVKVVDASDIVNSWTGLAVIGYSELKIPRMREKLFPFLRRTSMDQLSPTLRCVTVIKNAASGGLSAKCKLDTVKKAMMLIAGPQKEINVEGFSRARNWLEEATKTMEIRGGDYPVGGDHLHGVVLFSGMEDLPRLKELREKVRKD